MSDRISGTDGKRSQKQTYFSINEENNTYGPVLYIESAIYGAVRFDSQAWL